jgi:hypothetical protein
MSSSGQPLSSNRPARCNGNAPSEAVASRLLYQSSGLQAARHTMYVCMYVVDGCLQIRCLETDCVTSLLYCCVRVHFRGNMFIDPLPSNRRLLWLYYSGLQASYHNNIHVCTHVDNMHNCKFDNYISFNKYSQPFP